MLKAHYCHILSEFSELMEFDSYSPSFWDAWYEGNAVVSDLRVMCTNDGWNIEDPHVVLFSALPTEKMANQILERIKQTEILFV